MAKATKTVVAQRVEAVYALRLSGAELHDIRQYASAPEQAWGLSDRQLWRYVARADRLMKERCDARADHLLARHILQRRTLFARAVEAQDYRTALAVLDSEAKLEGLFVTKIAPTNPEGTEPYVLSDTDRAAALGRLYAALGAGAGGAPALEQAAAAGPILGAAGGDPGGGPGSRPGPLADEPAPLFG